MRIKWLQCKKSQHIISLLVRKKETPFIPSSINIFTAFKKSYYILKVFSSKTAILIPKGKESPLTIEVMAVPLMSTVTFQY